MGVATATATAMAVTVAQPLEPKKPEVHQNVDLAAAIRLLPNANQVPDLTGGLGSVVYDANQALADVFIRAVVNGINLSALGRAAGVDPQSLITGLLADLPANLLPGILAALALDVPVLDPALGALTSGDVALLTTILNLLGVDEVTDGTLTGLLALLGLDLSDPLNLAGLDVPGLNVVTAGPTFTALKLLGLDLGWVPSLPNSVADEINGTDYLELGVDGVLDVLLERLQTSTLPGASALVAPLAALIADLTDPLTSQLPDVIDVRATPTVGIGIGAFAAAMAYRQVLAQLPSQPGGSQSTGIDPLLGSLTILPLVLINNPARPDGGAAARFGFLGSLVGIDTVNPRTQVSSDGEGIPVLGTGVTLGAANLLPIVIDGAYEYQPLSDLAAWPNPFTLLNNLSAALSPTYMLRGLSLDGLDDQILGQVTDALGNVTAGNPLALNLYLTLDSATLPTLEPLYLAADFLNLVGLGPLAQIPMRLANALAPALSTLVDIGYANVVRNADGTYTRDFTDAGTETPFFSFADIDYAKVPGDVIGQLIAGFGKEFFSDNPTPGTPNALANLLGLLDGEGLPGLGLGGTPSTPGGTPGQDPLGGLLDGLGGLLGGLGGLNPLALAAQAPSAIPSPNARITSLADPETEITSAGEDSVAAEAAALAEGAPAAEESTGPKHAKPEAAAGEDVVDGETTTAQPPKHAKPDDVSDSEEDDVDVDEVTDDDQVSQDDEDDDADADEDDDTDAADDADKDDKDAATASAA